MQDTSESMEKVLTVDTASTSEDNTTDNTQEVHWTETRDWLGNTYNVVPTQGMMVGKGTLILRKRPIRKLRTIVSEEFYQVRYDRDYVVAWLAQRVVKPFSWLPYNEFQKIVSDAMKLLKAQEDNGLIQRKSPYKRSID